MLGRGRNISQRQTPLYVGITGGVATGKSTVTRLLRAKGVTTFSADEAARAILSPGGTVLRAITEAFGTEMLDEEGGLDRKKLGQRVFADLNARRQLEAITHPPVLRLLRAQMEATWKDFSPRSLVALEVPLLFEINLQSWFERIVVVTASPSVQLARLQARSGDLDAKEARRRLAAQWPLETKVARADDVLENSGSLAELTKAVEGLWERLQALCCPPMCGGSLSSKN